MLAFDLHEDLELDAVLPLVGAVVDRARHEQDAAEQEQRDRTVMMPAIVISRLRRSEISVSRVKYARRDIELGTDSVDAAHLVADERAVVELHHAAAHRVDDALVVRRHDDGGAGAVDAVEQPHDADGRRGVEVSGRLVGEQDQRTVHERARDRHPLLLTTRQLGREVVGLLREADEVEDLRHLRADDVLRAADHLERERDVLVDRLVR